ncbi:MAG: uncharacterized protein JWR09_3779 [Mucilaginibacter sp.]|nr:uncharacterized protein [Mucilaginibacter sp.]
MRFQGNRSIDKLLLFYSRKIPDHPFKIRFVNLLNRLVFKKSIQLNSSSGATFFLSTDEYTGHELVYSGYYEPLTTALCDKLVSGGGNIIDVGASIGLFSIHLSKINGTMIYAVEPSVQNFASLLKNLALNQSKNVLPLNVALSDHDSFGYLENMHPQNSGTIKVVNSFDGNQAYLIRLTTLSELIQYLELKEIALLKIDVEGFEMNVFKGHFDNENAILPNNIIMEFNSMIDRTKYTTRECLDYILSLGYSAFNVYGAPYIFNDPLPESNLWLKKDC